jgi:hypothetical protein
MPEAAGRGEGETCADGKVIWVVDREPRSTLSRVLSEPNVIFQQQQTCLMFYSPKSPKNSFIRYFSVS